MTPVAAPGERPGRCARAVVVAVVLVALAMIAGCGSATSEAPEHPFGKPPAPAPGVLAWAAGEPGALLVTSDGGATWKRQRFFLSQRGVDVAFADPLTGWVVTDAGTVLRTVDGGARWAVVEQADASVKAVAAAGAAGAWVVGTAVSAAGDPAVSIVLYTHDGGESWRRSGFGMAQLADIAFVDERRGVLVALDRIWSTRDGGRTWRLRRTLPMTVLTSVAAGDERRLWVAGWDTRTGDPLVLATTDGGTTWRRLPIELPPAEPGALQARQIACGGEDRLWITCAAGVIATGDGGRSWELQQVPAGKPFAVAAADEGHVLATTEGQPLLATADGGATWLAYGSDGFLRRPLVAIAAVATDPAE